MSGFLSSKYLRYRAMEGENPPRDDSAMACRGCGYSLRGLPAFARCPECGLSSVDGTALAPLSPITPAARTMMRAGFLIMWLVMLAIALLRLAWQATAFVPTLDLSYSRYVIVMVLLSMLWAGAVWLVTPVTFDRLGRAAVYQRWFVRCAAIAYPLGYLLLVRDAMGNPGQIIDWAALSTLIRLIGGIGAVALLHLLGQAAWSSELSDESDALHNATVTLSIPSALIVLLPVEGSWFVFIWLTAVVLWWAIMVGRIAMVIHRLEQHVRWLGITVRSAADRMERIMEKRAEVDREVEGRIRPLR